MISINIILKLLYRVIFELIKRIITPFIYPISYIYRWDVRSESRTQLFYIPKHNKFYKFLWYILDDSIVIENIFKYGNLKEYCYYGKRCKIIETLAPNGQLKEFLRSFYWGAIRNNCINYSRIEAYEHIGQIIGVVKKINFINKKSFIELRRFTLTNALYIEIHIYRFFFQCGYLSNGRFEMEFKLK